MDSIPWEKAKLLSLGKTALRA